MPGTGPESWLASKLTPQNIINSGSMYPLQEPGFHGEQKKRACTLMELQDTKKNSNADNNISDSTDQQMKSYHHVSLPTANGPPQNPLLPLFSSFVQASEQFCHSVLSDSFAASTSSFQTQPGLPESSSSLNNFNSFLSFPESWNEGIVEFGVSFRVKTLNLKDCLNHFILRNFTLQSLFPILTSQFNHLAWFSISSSKLFESFYWSRSFGQTSRLLRFLFLFLIFFFVDCSTLLIVDHLFLSFNPVSVCLV